MKEIKDATRKPFWYGFTFLVLLITLMLLCSCKKEEPTLIEEVDCKCGIITEIKPVYSNGFWSHDDYFARNDCSMNVGKIFMGQYLNENDAPMVGAWVCINEEW